MASYPQVELAVIGGSGVYKMDGIDLLQEVDVDTPFGNPSDKIKICQLEGRKIAFLPRHGADHSLTPTVVPYRANMYALKLLGVRACIAVNACGSLQEGAAPGDVVVPHSILDVTKFRTSTFFQDGIVAHVPMAETFCKALSAQLVAAVKHTIAADSASATTCHARGVYTAIEGPRFSTEAESHAFRAQGGTIIGMTGAPEAFLAREAQIAYAMMAHVTDYDVWHPGHDFVTVEAVIGMFKKNVGFAQAALRRAVREIDVASLDSSSWHSLAGAIMTRPDAISAQAKLKVAALIEGYQFV